MLDAERSALAATKRAIDEHLPEIPEWCEWYEILADLSESFGAALGDFTAPPAGRGADVVPLRVVSP